MPGFTSRDDLINEITVNSKQDLWNFYKISPAAAQGAGTWHSLWKGVGNPGAGADPAGTPGAAYDSDAGSIVAGSMWFPDRAADERYLLSFGVVSPSAGTVMLYDRLVGVSGISLASTGAKTVNSAALTRYTATDAILNEVWLEVTTAPATTAPALNLDSYTSADGTTAQVGGSVTLPSATTAVGSMIQLPLTAAKQGVRSVQAGVNVTAAGTAGAANVLIIRPLVRVPISANQWNEISLLDDTMGLPRIFDNACLGLAFLPIAGATPTVWGQVNCAFG